MRRGLAPVHRQIAIGDLVLFSILAVPGIGAAVIGVIADLNQRLNLGGAMQQSAAQDLFIHLVGVLGVGFAALRLLTEPNRVAAATVVVVKLWAVGLFAVFVWRGAPQIFLLFGLVDLVQSALLIAALRLTASHRISETMSNGHNLL